MPRQRFDDPTTPGRYAQINWQRQTDTTEPGPQYVQISTCHDGESTVSRLIGWAIGIVSNVDAPATGWPNQTDEWREAARKWLDDVAAHAPELTGEFVQVGPDEIDGMIKTLHKAKRQAFGKTRPTRPTGPVRVIGDEQVAAAERGVYLPGEGRTV